MKFTNGYWLIRPNFQMQYATQAVRVEKRPDALHVLSACRPIHHRGDTLDGGTLENNLIIADSVWIDSSNVADYE